MIPGPLTVEAPTRDDAVGLLERLRACDCELVALEDGAWGVVVRPHGDRGELARTLRAVEEWVAQLRLRSTVVEVDGRPHTLVARAAEVAP